MKPAQGRAIIVRRQPTTWNPADIDASITLSSDRLNLTGSVVNRSARAISGRLTGLLYYEVTVLTSTANASIGIANSSPVLTTWMGNVAGSIGWVGASGVFEASGSIGTHAAFAVNDVCGIAVNIDRKLIWTRANAGNWNNSATANPSTGVGGYTFAASGPFFPAVTPGNTGGLTANFGPNFPTQYGPPPGFSLW